MPLLLTPFGEFEFLNAIELRVFRKEITTTQAEASLRLFHDDLDAGSCLRRALPANAYERAVMLSRRHTRQLGTRGMDILHVAIALELGSELFFTFDQSQRRLAHASGLTVRPGR